MRSIYKYDITTVENGIIEGPITKLLSVQAQRGSIMVWAEVDTDKLNRKFQIIPIGTGWPLDAPTGEDCILDTHNYIGTVQLAGGALVFHVYAAEVLPKVEKKETKITNQKEATFHSKNCRINTEVLAKFL